MPAGAAVSGGRVRGAGSPELLSATVVALDDLWGSVAIRIQERLRDAASWDNGFAIAEAALGRRLEAGHSIARVAVESGYVDQSHLHRDVMAFTGMTPTAVAVAPWLAVDDIAWPTRGQIVKLLSKRALTARRK